MPDTGSLPPMVRAYVARYVAWQRALALLRAGGWAVAVTAAWLLGCGLADRILPLPGAVRLALLCAGAVMPAALLWRPLWKAMAWRVRWAEAAAQIDRANPIFGERLATVVSRTIGAAEYQGSPAMLGAVRDELRHDLRSHPMRHLLRLRAVARAWIAAALSLVILAAATQSSWFQFGSLMRRLLHPLAAAVPVTTVRLSVLPGDCAVEQDQPLAITATAHRLARNRAAQLHISRVRDGWAEQWMSQTFEDEQFTVTVPSVDREIRYFVSAGDARSPVYTVRVKRRPVLKELRAQLEFPAYMNRPTTGPVVIVGPSGGPLTLEAPIKTEALLTIVAGEDLKDAAVMAGETRIATSPTVDPRSRQAKLTILRDEPLRIEMTSVEDVKGGGPGGMTIRAIPDRPPVVDLLVPSAELTLTPRRIVPVRARIADDVGVSRIVLVVQINNGPEQQRPVEVWGDPRRQVVELELDLAEWPLKVGDLFAFYLRAADGLGQTDRSPSRQVLIAPRAVDFDTHLRIAELKAVADQATALAGALEAIRPLLDEAAKEEGTGQGAAARSKLDQALAAAADDGASLRQRIVRTVACSGGGQLAVALANWADKAHLGVTAIQVVRRRPAGGAMLDPSRDELAAVRERMAAIALEATSAYRGELAGAALALKANIEAAMKRNTPKSAERLRQELAAAAKELMPTTPVADPRELLAALVATGEMKLRSYHPVDFAADSLRWAKALSRPAASNPLDLVLDERLELAGVIEAIRPDSDLLRSRDLRLASAAAGRIAAHSFDAAATSPATRAAWPAEARKEYPMAMAALQREHELNRRTDGRAAEAGPIQEAAEAARQKMRRWAGDAMMLADNSRPTSAPADWIAMEANAAMADRQYDRARKLDEMLARNTPSRVVPPDDRAAAMERLRRLDELAEEQRMIARDVEKAASADAGELARRQAVLASRIEAAERWMERGGGNPDQEPPHTSREDARAEMAGAARRLSKLDGEITDTERATAERKQAQRQVQAAKQATGGRDEAARAAARKALDQAHQNLADAITKEKKALDRTSPDAMDVIATNLKRYAPETDRTTSVLEEKLTPALRELRQAMDKDDGPQAVRVASAARAAAARAVEELGAADEELARQDPLAGAAELAEQAADALRRSPAPDTKEALRQADKAEGALRLAWRRQALQTAGSRLRDVPGMETLLQPYEDRDAARAGGPISPPSRPDSAGGVDWGQLRRRQGDIASGRQEAEVPGYDEAIKAYFEALSKEK